MCTNNLLLALRDLWENQDQQALYCPVLREKQKLLDILQPGNNLKVLSCESIAVVLMPSYEVIAGVKMLFHFKLTLISSNTSNYLKGLGNQITFISQEIAVF